MKLLATTVIAATVLVSAFSGAAHAAGSASFSLSPASGSHVQGTSFTVTVRETGSNVNVVNAKMTYDPSKLSCNSIGASSAFPATVQANCGGGSITISRYTNPGDPAVNGTQTIGTINFTALANSGSADVKFAAGSQIVSNGVNEWNGSTTGGTYTFTAPAPAPTPTPTPTPTPAPKKTTTTKKTATTTPAVESATTTAAPTTTAATDTAPKSETKKTETPTKKTNNSATAWIIVGLMAAAAGATAALYGVNKRREAAEAAAAAARKARAAKKPATRSTKK
jgi:hypothetical protein